MDVTNLTASGDPMTDVQYAVYSNLKNLRNWLMANKLGLNIAKTEFMLLDSRQMIKGRRSPKFFSLKTNKLSKSINAKTLGIIVDQHLSWKIYTKNVCKKITERIRALRLK